MHLPPRFTLIDDDMSVTTDDGWVLATPSYCHYFTPMPLIAQQTDPPKRETRSVLKKRRTFTESPRLRLPKEQLPPRPSSYIEPSQPPQTMQIPFPHSSSVSKPSAMLPSLRTDSLWLNRPTQPLRIRKSSQSLQTSPPRWNGAGTSYVVSNSPILPIGGNSLPRPTTPRTVKSSSLSAKTAASAVASTSALIPPVQASLETLMASVESDFKRVRLSSRPISVATSVSVYSQASASYSLIHETQIFENDSCASKKDDEATDTYSIRSAETIQLSESQRPSTDQSAAPRDDTVFNLDPRLSTSTSKHTSDTTPSTLSTLVHPSTPRKDKKHLESTKLSLQPCPSLASANRILSLSDLPPNHDAPSPIDENTYRRYEHEGTVDSPFIDDICADYDYIHAIDVLIYGERPLPNVPADVIRHPSRPRPKRDNSIRQRGSDKKSAPVFKRIAHNTPPISFNRTARKNSFKTDRKDTAMIEAGNEHKDDRRSVFFQVTHFFGKNSSS